MTTRTAPRILVVDDEPRARRLSTQVLVRSGYLVDTANDGPAAWEALNSENYDLLITDQNMPRLSGAELIKKLRVAGLDLPAIMTTGAIPIEEFENDPDTQPAVTLLKPFTIDELLGTVKAVLHLDDGGPRD